MTELEEMARDIETMRVRGAAAIARHGADALARWEATAPRGDFERRFGEAKARLLATRPTAVSLRNALEFVERRALAARDEDARRAAVRAAASEFSRRSEAALATLGRIGAGYVRDGKTYLTHCNSQAAVSVFRAATEAGKSFRVVVNETRPWRQGLLTARDLRAAGVENVAFAVDAATRLHLAQADAVVVGADTLAANGDVVNKVGTSLVALAAKEANVPFYVAAETYKVDLRAPTGAEVPIEEREASEVAAPGELPDGVSILNPVFDVTPASWVRRVFTEAGDLPPAEVATVARKSWT